MKLPNRAAAGFTLIELMVVVAVIAIVATIAIGGTVDWRRQMDHTEVVRAVFNTLNTARAEAVQRGQRVTARLETGVLVAFFDANGNLEFDTDEQPAYFEFRGEQASWLLTGTPTGTWGEGITVDAGDDATARNGAPVVMFDNMGTCVDILGEPFAGRITITDTEPDGRTRHVDVTMAGALRVKK